MPPLPVLDRRQQWLVMGVGFIVLLVVAYALGLLSFPTILPPLPAG